MDIDEVCKLFIQKYTVELNGQICYLIKFISSFENIKSCQKTYTPICGFFEVIRSQENKGLKFKQWEGWQERVSSSIEGKR